jgi:single-strand DNA-binding protein
MRAPDSERSISVNGSSRPASFTIFSGSEVATRRCFRRSLPFRAALPEEGLLEEGLLEEGLPEAAPPEGVPAGEAPPPFRAEAGGGSAGVLRRFPSGMASAPQSEPVSEPVASIVQDRFRGAPQMANLNKVFLIGRLTRDPEARSLKSGSSLVTFGLAVNRTYYRGGGEGGSRGEGGEKVEETCFIDVEAWGRTGDTIARYTKKGRQLFVEGRLRFDSWEKDGQRRSKLVVVCENFQFLDAAGSNGGRMSDDAGGREPVSSRASSSSSGGGSETTPQDDYPDAAGADDIPF